MQSLRLPFQIAKFETTYLLIFIWRAENDARYMIYWIISSSIVILHMIILLFCMNYKQFPSSLLST